jgi:hypothetical protein
MSYQIPGEPEVMRVPVERVQVCRHRQAVAELLTEEFKQDQWITTKSGRRSCFSSGNPFGLQAKWKCSSGDVLCCLLRAISDPRYNPFGVPKLADLTSPKKIERASGIDSRPLPLSQKGTNRQLIAGFGYFRTPVTAARPMGTSSRPAIV